jgi:hypothetical protein
MLLSDAYQDFSHAERAVPELLLRPYENSTRQLRP